MREDTRPWIEFKWGNDSFWDDLERNHSENIVIVDLVDIARERNVQYETGPGQDHFLKPSVIAWLNDNIERSTFQWDFTGYLWFKVYFTAYLDCVRDEDGTAAIFRFDTSSDALLFKLTWGGA